MGIQHVCPCERAIQLARQSISSAKEMLVKLWRARPRDPTSHSAPTKQGMQIIKPFHLLVAGFSFLSEVPLKASSQD